MSNSVRSHRRQPTRLPRPCDSPGENTGVGCHFLLQCVKVKSFSCVRLFPTPWTGAYQTPPFMGFSRQEYWRNFNEKLVIFGIACVSSNSLIDWIFHFWINFHIESASSKYWYKVKSLLVDAKSLESCLTLWSLQPTRLLCPWDACLGSNVSKRYIVWLNK